MRLNIPTFLTLFRVALIPLFIICFYLPFQWSGIVTASIFLLAAVTDWLDGFLARRWNQTTPFGAFLDPVADKVMVGAALVLVVEHYHVFWITLPAIIMLSREIIISALREWMAQIGDSSKVAVSWLGKVKTTAQMISLIGLLWRPTVIIEWIAIAAFYVAAILTIWSMWNYLVVAKTSLLQSNDE